MASMHRELFYHRLVAPSLRPAKQYRPSEPATSQHQGDSKGIQDLLPGLKDFYKLKRDRHHRLALNSTPEVSGSIIRRERFSSYNRQNFDGICVQEHLSFQTTGCT